MVNNHHFTSVNTEINSALTALENLSPAQLKEFQKQFNSKFKSAGSTCDTAPATPAKTTTSNLITTPVNLSVDSSARDCLHQVGKITKSSLGKNSITRRAGRRKLTDIYNKMRKGKREAQPRQGRKLRQYDVNDRGDELFESAYKLMFEDGYTANSAAKQTVGKPHQNAFRIALCTCVVCMRIVVVVVFFS